MKVYEAIARALVQEGVDTVFGVTGGLNGTIYELVNTHDVRYVAARHEQGAVGMADGYSRATGRPGVAFVSPGPGLTNAATTMTAARLSGSQVVVLAADIASTSRWSNMRIDQPPLIQATMGAIEEVEFPDQVGENVQAAFRHIRVGLGPIVLNVRYDIAAGVIPDGWVYVPSERILPQPQMPQPDPARLADACRLIAGSNRPVILAGRGAVEAGARAALIELADRIGAVLATSLLAKGYFAGQPFNVGLSGGFACDAARDLLGEADLVLAFGASMNDHTFEYGHMYPIAKLIQVDVDARRLGEMRPVDVAIAADADATARALQQQVEPQPRWRTAEMSARIEAIDPWAEHEMVEEPGYIDRFQVARSSEALLPRDRVVVIGVGHYMGLSAARISVPEPRNQILPWRLGAIGSGLPVALGAAIGRPDQTTVLFEGDGSLMMALAELDTAVRHRVPMLVICHDDGGYGAERAMFIRRGWNTELSDFKNPDFAAVASDLGWRSFTASNTTELEQVLSELGPVEVPTFINVKVHPDVWDPGMDRAMNMAPLSTVKGSV